MMPRYTVVVAVYQEKEFMVYADSKLEAERIAEAEVHTALGHTLTTDVDVLECSKHEEPITTRR